MWRVRLGTLNGESVIIELFMDGFKATGIGMFGTIPQHCTDPTQKV